MRIPKMILFDYGQTLGNEAPFDGLKGTKAILEHTIQNKHQYTAEDIQREVDDINDELGRFDPARRHLIKAEIPNTMFSRYLYESMGIVLDLSPEESSKVFWNASSPAVPTEGIAEFLDFLKAQGIRIGVISNITYDENTVEKRIRELLPNHEFEFIIATSEYMFRKPNRRIFDLALEKAGLTPEDVWYIGDKIECDVDGALNAGIFPVWYTGALDRPQTELAGVLKINHWAGTAE